MHFGCNCYFSIGAVSRFNSAAMKVSWLLCIICIELAPSFPWNNGFDSSWALLAGRGGLDHNKCVPIPKDMKLCHGLSKNYNKMRLPNLLDHETMEEAVDQSQSWVPLVRFAKCHPHTQVFLCSLYAPVCLDQHMEPVRPCRSLCLSVKGGCEHVMQKYNYTWPDILDCENSKRFPRDNPCVGPPPVDNRQADDVVGSRSSGGSQSQPTELEIAPGNEGNERSSPASIGNVCAACTQPDSSEAIVHSYCMSNVAMRVKVRNVNSRNGRSLLTLTTAKKRKVFKSDGVPPRALKRSTLVIDVSTCNCEAIERTRGAYLVFANYKRNNSGNKGQLTVTLISSWRSIKRNRQFKKAMRMIKKKSACAKDGVVETINKYKSEYQRKTRRRRRQQQIERRNRRLRQSNYRYRKNTRD